MILRGHKWQRSTNLNSTTVLSCWVSRRVYLLSFFNWLSHCQYLSLIPKVHSFLNYLKNNCTTKSSFMIHQVYRRLVNIDNPSSCWNFLFKWSSRPRAIKILNSFCFSYVPEPVFRSSETSLDSLVTNSGIYLRNEPRSILSMVTFSNDQRRRPCVSEHGDYRKKSPW